MITKEELWARLRTVRREGFVDDVAKGEIKAKKMLLAIRKLLNFFHSIGVPKNTFASAFLINWRTETLADRKVAVEKEYTFFETGLTAVSIIFNN